MRIEIVIFIVAAGVIANMYYDGKLLKRALTYTKYYKMAGVVISALFVYYLIKKNPAGAKELISSSNEYIKYLPIDRNTTNMLSPILDFTAKNSWKNTEIGETRPIVSMNASEFSAPNPYSGGGRGGGNGKVKRSVSETKKKYVAARQQWYCGHCKNILNHTFEIDHVISLNNGGSNHVDNLVALCPACHREKTAAENMESQI